VKNFNKIYKYTSDLDILYLRDNFSPAQEKMDLMLDLFHHIEVVEDFNVGVEKYNVAYLEEGYYYDVILLETTWENQAEFIKKILSIYPEQIFIVITEADEITHLTPFINQGLVYLLLKPFDIDSLYNILFKVSKSITNERLADEHLRVTEAFNIHLQDYNDTLNSKLEEKIKDLEQSQATIINQSKFAVMGEMIAMIAHQWKQPLNVISLNIASLQMMHLTGKYSKQELGEIIENSNETIEYMSKTIQDFTEFLKPSEIREKLKIGTIFYQLMSLVKSDIQQYGIDFSINFKLDKELIIELNSSKFTQVIINIIKNAIDEFKSKHIESPTISIDIELIDNVYTISVQDNAGGIPLEILDTIFEPYVSTKGKNGTGLGMYMSKLLVESHLGGTIDVSNKNGGALFSLKLPIKGSV
jgi:signal transduction histidine kinase